MSSLTVSRLAPIFAALGLFLFASSARAQFGECVDPADVPGEVFDTIVGQAGFDFGSISEKACKSIVKKGVSTCRKQVKDAAKCFDHAFDGNYVISVKQCNQLAKGDRKDCKSDAKSIRKDGKSDTKDAQQEGLATCKEDFESALQDACEGGVT